MTSNVKGCEIWDAYMENPEDNPWYPVTGRVGMVQSCAGGV